MNPKKISITYPLVVLALALLSGLALGKDLAPATHILAWQRLAPLAPDDAVPIVNWGLDQLDPALGYSFASTSYLVIWQHQWAANTWTAINGRLVFHDGAPVLEPFSISQAAKSASAPDIAYNATNGQFLVVWELEYSATDHDIYARLIDAEGAPTGSEIVISSDGAYESAPVAAYNSTLNEYMIAWVFRQSLGGGAYQDRIVGQRLSAGGTAIGGRAVLGASAGDAGAPDLAYSPASEQYLLVWNGEDAGGDMDLVGQRLLYNGVQVGGTILIADWANDQLDPRLAYNPERDEFLATWTDYHWDLINSQIYAQRIQASNGELAGDAIIPPNQSPAGNLHPDVAYQPEGRGYRIVWEYAASFDNHDVYQVLYSGTGGILETSAAVSNRNTFEGRPALAADSSDGAELAWQDNRDSATTGFDIYGLRAGVSLPTFTGNVYLGDSGDERTPQPGVTVGLYCSNTADDPGALVSVVQTGSSGDFSLGCYATCEFYNILETDPPDTFSVDAVSPGGVKKSSNWIQFTPSLQGKNLEGNKFWDNPSTPVDTTPPAGWMGFSPTSWTISQVPHASVQVEDTQSGLDATSAQFSFSTDGGGSWSSWQEAGYAGPNGSTVPETVYADVPFLQDSGPLSANLVKFSIRDRAGNPGASPAYPVMVDSTPPTNPGYIASSTHTPGAWSNLTTVKVGWPAGFDSRSGLYGYSYSWDQAADTLPNDTRDTQATDAASAPLADSSGYWFHLCALDVAGNAAVGAAHIGPFRIDTVSPTATYLAPKGSLNMPGFSVLWSGADDRSGIDRFDVEISQDNLTWNAWRTNTPDTSAPFTGERGQSYFFRVRARDYANNLSGWSYSGSVHVGIASTVQVRDENGAPLKNASVYLNTAYQGKTDPLGVRTVPDVLVGDTLAADYEVNERYSNKPGHGGYGNSNWAWQDYWTSVRIENSGSTILSTVTDPSLVQILVVRKNQALIMMHILVSVEWDAETSYMNDLRAGLRDASTYLYDVTDGQFVWGRVEVFDNGVNWENADVRIYADKQLWPHTNWAIGALHGIGGVTAGTDMQIHMPPAFAGRPYSDAYAYRVFIHEFGHYGLWLADEYLDKWGGKSSLGFCTWGRKVTPAPPQEILGSMMDNEAVTSELCSRVDPMNQHNKYNFQDAYNDGQTTWETILSRYSGGQLTLQSPDTRGSIMPGPDAIPIPNWVIVDAYDGSTGACAPFIVKYAWPENLNPAEGVHVWLIRPNNYPNWPMYEGATNEKGEIQILGAHNGEVLLASTSGALIFAKDSAAFSQVTDCDAVPATAAAVPGPAARLAQDMIVLQPNPFSLAVRVMPLTDNTVQVQAAASRPLPVPPTAALWQDGAALPIAVNLIYDPGSQRYLGQAGLNLALGRSGYVDVRATDSDNRSVTTLEPFNIQTATANQFTPYLRSADGKFELMLPPGRLKEDALVTIQPAEIAAAGLNNLRMVGRPYQVFVSSGQDELNDTATVNLYFSPDQVAGVRPETLRLYRWDDQASRWIPAGGSTVNLEHSLVSTSTDHLSVFALLGQPATGVKIYLPVVRR